VEKAVRKLLVASQKSGVGKTTTAINLAAATALSGARVLLVEADPLSGISAALNLAQHPERRPLRASGIDLPGILCSGVLPHLDVFNPYEEGGCTDEDFDRVLQLLALDAFRESYDCLVVNAPPFLGGRPGQLLASCDDYLIVMQAEPLAYRTMPAFLELVQRSGKELSHPPTLRGVLLTLPESEAPGGRWERELRGRFGSRVLAQVIPYDEEVGKASLFGHIVVHASPESPAAQAYQDLAGELHLARGAKGAARPVETTLTLAAAAVRANPLVSRAVPPIYTGRKSSGRIPRFQPPTPPRTVAEPPARTEPNLLSAEPLPPAPAPRERPSRPSGVRKPVASVPPVAPTAVAETVATPPASSSMHSTQRPWLIWVGLAVAAGLGLRFVRLPDFVLPVVVGLAVTAGVTLALHLSLGQDKEEATPAASPPTPSPSTSRKKSSR
jgi:chromosome partitioning protein